MNAAPAQNIYISCVLEADDNFYINAQIVGKGGFVIAHLLRSIQPITSRLKPSVLAASRRRRCVPLSTARWSTRLSSTSRPCARKSSSRASAPSRNVCSCSAYCSRLAPSSPPRNGFSDASPLLAVLPSRCEGAEEGGAKRRRASGVRGVPVLVEKSSARCAAAR